jgi:nicotinate dehydrogenase subunit A
MGPALDNGAIMSIDLTVNGRAVSVTAAPDTPLLDVLRNHLDLKGSRYGCGLEQCGSCMVTIDGHADYSCAREVGSVAGKRIETVESLANHPLHQAFLDEQAMHCGYCYNGQTIKGAELLAHTPHPTEAQIRSHMDGHLCRCGTYPRIMKSIQTAAAKMSKEG